MRAQVPCRKSHRKGSLEKRKQKSSDQLFAQDVRRGKAQVDILHHHVE